MYHKVLMRVTTGLICLAVGVMLVLACVPEAGPQITVTEDSLEISVMEVEGGILVENVSGVVCIVFVMSPEDERQSALAAGQSVTVIGITAPIRVSVVAA